MDFTRVQAIWATLDEMAAKDPEGYKNFIQEQMTGAQDFFKQMKPKSTDPNFVAPKGTETKKEAADCNKKDSGKIHDVLDQFVKLDIQAENSLPNANSSTHNKLTDDVFSLQSSLLSTIVKEEDRLGDADTEKTPIVNLNLSTEADKLGSEKEKKEKKKPLIEIL